MNKPNNVPYSCNYQTVLFLKRAFLKSNNILCALQLNLSIKIRRFLLQILHAICVQCLMKPFNFQNLCLSNQILSSSPEVVTNMICLILFQYYSNVQILRPSNTKANRILFMCCCTLLMFPLILSDYIYPSIYVISSIMHHTMIHVKLLIILISNLYVLMYRKKYYRYLL